ncbi:Rv2578c family radical SAM protein [Streptomyces roseofulvus]|uniref:radical SAM protein n=1 Tax=Streptomyces roseofulvus TaxID=33902 RepID=UPI0031FBF8F8
MSRGRSIPSSPCRYACVYCFARKTHSYLDLDTGLGFDSQIVVKVNAAELLTRQLASRRWQGAHIAMGTNVDCYQRAEGRYRLMPGILTALRDRANPFSILTKGTLILRDLELLTQAAEVTEVGVSVSVGFTDEELWRTIEPGTPSPHRRLDVVRALGEHGIGCGVLMAPVVPFLGDSPEQLRATVRAIAEAGAVSVTPLVLHLRPGAREWFMSWLARHHPRLVGRYERMYADGAYAPTWYQRRITRQVHELAAEFGIGPARRETPRRLPRPAPAPPTGDPEQLTLL